MQPAEEEEEEYGPKLIPSSNDKKRDISEVETVTEEEVTNNTKKIKLDEQAIHLLNLPNAQMYEKSYLHKSVISHLIVTPQTNFLITASTDGIVKFWKKQYLAQLEFVKTIKAHFQPIHCLQSSPQGLYCISATQQGEIKIFDVINFDMINVIKLDFEVEALQIMDESHVAIVKRNSHQIFIYNYLKQNTVKEDTISLPQQTDFETDSNISSSAKEISSTTTTVTPLYSIEHMAHKQSHIICITYCPVQQVFLTIDRRGIAEYWQLAPGTKKLYKHPMELIQFTSKSETDLFELMKSKGVYFVQYNAQGTQFVTMSHDQIIRIFDFKTGKIVLRCEETLHHYQQLQKNNELGLENFDFGRRFATEKEIIEQQFSNRNCLFDASGTCIIYGTPVGIKIVDIASGETKLVLGKVENMERFCYLALFQKRVKMPPKSQQKFSNASQLDWMSGGGNNSTVSSTEAQLAGLHALQNLASAQEVLRDPCIFSTAYKKHRFYIFSRREPLEMVDANGQLQQRDVFNEKPNKEDMDVHAELNKHSLPSLAIMHTNMGDIHLKLFAEDCPKAVENFITHAKNGYYNNIIFHRVIKEFMIQTGDPKGDGTGGESIWGGSFSDEIKPHLKHDTPFKLSMANSGPNSNGSQFFITTVPTPWLDGKHTLFGEVIKGKDVVKAIESVKVDKKRGDKPLVDVYIINIEVIKVL